MTKLQHAAIAVAALAAFSLGAGAPAHEHHNLGREVPGLRGDPAVVRLGRLGELDGKRSHTGLPCQLTVLLVQAGRSRIQLCRHLHDLQELTLTWIRLLRAPPG